MSDLKKAYKKLNIRAEVLLAELMDKSDVFDGKNIVLKPIGPFNKSLKTDITHIQLHDVELEDDTYEIQVARRGLYDTLPEGLFHDPTTKLNPTGGKKKTEQVLLSIKERRQQEKNVRKFFAPFDQAFNHYRLVLEEEERKVLTGFPIGSRHTLFDIIWGGFGNSMTNYQKSTLFSILPMAHHIAGNIPYTELAFYAILGFKTQIKIEYIQGNLIHLGEENTLGSVNLSQDFVLGNISEEYENIYQININNIPTTNIIDFLPNGKSREVIKILCGFLLPAELEYNYTMNFDCEPLYLEEDAPTDINCNRLGYGIVI